MMVEERITLSGEQHDTLAAVLSTLLPGGEGFPGAAEAGTTAFLLEQLDADGLRQWLLPLLADLDDQAGGQFVLLSVERRIEVLQHVEATQPLDFARLLALTYYSYYAQPAVIAAIRALGHDYQQTPQPEGYAMAPFDPANPLHLPPVPHGSYKRTLQMARVVLS